jgi:phosphatidylglycerol phospholipase C
MPICRQYLPDFPIVHIGWNTGYARKFLNVPGVSFNMFQKMVIGPAGAAFRRDVREAGRSLFLWTVNDETSMKWCISNHVDGVITDDPKKYLELCDSYNGEKVNLPLLVWVALVIVDIFSPFVNLFFRLKFRRQRRSRQAT